MAENEINVLTTEEYEVKMDEFTPIVISEGGTMNHALLNNREKPNQHPILAIEGLREELDSLGALKTFYSDKYNVANYYKWNDAAYDECGYFVSIAPGTSEIKICDGADILGVSVDSAGFVGGQDATTPRNNGYGLIVTSGIVSVRCELDVNVGDCVVSNDKGYATKSVSDYGYKVLALAKDEETGDTYAIILLGVQADRMNALGLEVDALDSRVDAGEKNVVSAINLANQAYKKAQESTTISEEALREALGAIKKSEESEDAVKDIEEVLTSVSGTSAQAKAIAESAVTSAASMKAEAVEKADKALVDTSELRKDFAIMGEGITEIENQISVIVTENSEQGTAIAGIRTDVTEQDAKIDNLVSWQGDANITMARIEEKADANGAYIQSTVSNINKYAVGPHSQAYGFTLDQAISVLDEGIIYVPTEDITEAYEYTDPEGNKLAYERRFIPGYLYEWGKLNDYSYGWITVDKYYKETVETEGDNTSIINTSSMAVFFSVVEIALAGNNDYGYWYTNGDVITNIDGTTGTYDPYTLYKWDLPYKYKDEDGATDVEEYHWVAVATLTGNVNNRMTSQIRQDANNISAEIVNIHGSMAALDARVTDTASEIQSITAWTKDDNGNQYNLAAIKQTADEAGADIALVVEERDGNKVINGASIVAAVNESESTVMINADHINLLGRVTINDFDSDTASKLNNSITSTTIEYALSERSDSFVAIDGEGGQWSTTAPEWQENKYMWQRTTVAYTDSTKEDTVTTTCIQGAKGTDGNDGSTPEVGENGNWWINNTDTGVKAEGVDGNTPTVEINDDGYWVIDGEITDIKAIGKDGQNGNGVIKVVTLYYISDTNSSDSKPSNGAKDDNGWFENFDTMLERYWELKEASDATYYVWSQERVDYSDIPSTYSEPTVNSASSVVALYCKENGETKINGAHIATGTLDANKITTGTLKAIDIESDNYEVTTAEDGTPTITGMKISLSDGTWSSQNFKIHNDGGVSFAGTLEGAQGIFSGELAVQEIHIGSDTTDNGVHLDSTTIVTENLTTKNLTVSNEVPSLSVDTLNVGSATITTKSTTISTNQTRITFTGTAKTTITNQTAQGVYFVNISYTVRASASVPNSTTVTVSADINGKTYSSDVTISAGATSASATSTGNTFTSTPGLPASVTCSPSSKTYTTYVTSPAGLLVDNNFCPSTDNAYDIGGSTLRWDDMYATNGAIQTSDENEKNSIEELPEKYSDFFDRLTPVIFRRNNGTSGRYHVGLGARATEKALLDTGMSTLDFAGVIISHDEDEYGNSVERYGLRYEEFIGLCIYEIQELKKRIVELEDKLNTTQND